MLPKIGSCLSQVYFPYQTWCCLRLAYFLILIDGCAEFSALSKIINWPLHLQKSERHLLLAVGDRKRFNLARTLVQKNPARFSPTENMAASAKRHRPNRTDSLGIEMDDSRKGRREDISPYISVQRKSQIRIKTKQRERLSCGKMLASSNNLPTLTSHTSTCSKEHVSWDIMSFDQLHQRQMHMTPCNILSYEIKALNRGRRKYIL